MVRIPASRAGLLSLSCVKEIKSFWRAKQKAPNNHCLDLVNTINLREFSWKDDEEHKPAIGAIAQELRQVLPEKYVHEFIGGKEADDEYLSINDSKLVYLIIGAIQEQQKEIESLKAKIKIDSKIA